jgi:hypothetical protein
LVFAITKEVCAQPVVSTIRRSALRHLKIHGVVYRQSWHIWHLEIYCVESRLSSDFHCSHLSCCIGLSHWHTFCHSCCTTAKSSLVSHWRKYSHGQRAQSC